MATVNPPTVNEGQSATLLCSAKGNPAPTFRWFKNDEMLPNQEFQLKITRVKTEHDGRYNCEAENKHGPIKSQSLDFTVTCGYFFAADLALMLLFWKKKKKKRKHWLCGSTDRNSACFILDPPEVEIIKILPLSEAREGDEMILECRVKRSNPVPFRYRWYKTDELRSHFGNWCNKTLVPADRGAYTCEAENSAGQSRRSQIVRINFPCKCHGFSCRSVLSQRLQFDSVTQWNNCELPDGPRKPNIHPVNNQVKVGDSVTLYCETTADPSPRSYTWYRHTTHGVTTMYNSSTVNTLYLSGLKRGDEACYTCSATNSIKTGEPSEEACVRVLCKYAWRSQFWEVTWENKSKSNMRPWNVYLSGTFSGLQKSVKEKLTH